MATGLLGDGGGGHDNKGYSGGLPAEVWAHVASFLPPRELACEGLALTCHSFHSLCSLNALWAEAYARQWPSSRNISHGGGLAIEGEHSWKHKFKRRYQRGLAWAQGRYTREFIPNVDANVVQLSGDQMFFSAQLMRPEKGIICYDLNTSTIKRVLKGSDEDSYLAFHYNADNDCLLTADQSSRTLLLYDVSTARVKTHLTTPIRSDLECLAVQSDETKGVLGCNERIIVWDLQSNQILGHGAGDEVLRHHEEELRCLKYQDNNLWTGGGLGDNSAKLWDLRSDLHKPLETIRLNHGVWSMDFQDSLLALGSYKAIYVWDVRHLHAPLFQDLTAHGGHINMMQFDSDKMVTGGSNTVKVWDMQPLGTLRCEIVVPQLNTHYQGICSGWFDNNLLACTSNNKDDPLVLYQFDHTLPVNNTSSGSCLGEDMI